jgi:hypothetical protein
MGPNGIFTAMTFAFSLVAVIGVVLFRSGRWKTAAV